ncbi:hypothetical protein L915_19951 [Phytophthora nicotianae]|uniref:Uncharacterized protein n=1 Tax=Phytophthora nicotianae TaxID=4792 RepID=W2FSM3_PHYNI|nr:hypothetical protein L915_19951 [Phytophthora nicotianae]
MVVLRMKEMAEAFLGQRISQAVVTAPAYFNNQQRQSTKDVVSIAGLDLQRINNETSVAALAYGLDTNAGTDGKACNVQIFVLGGGTVDVSILSIRVRHLEVKSTGGDSAEDSDNNMVQHLLTEFERKIRNLDPSGSARASDVTACESAKRMLLSTTSASVEVTSLFEGVEFSSTVVTRAKFESLNEELFMRCEVIVFKVLEDAKMKPEDWCGSEVLHVFPHAVHAVPRQGAVQVSQPGRGSHLRCAVQGATLDGISNDATNCCWSMSPRCHRVLRLWASSCRCSSSARRTCP